VDELTHAKEAVEKWPKAAERKAKNGNGQAT